MAATAAIDSSIVCSPATKDESANTPQFYFENGLRKVYPYYFVYTTYTKQRWLGKRLKDVMLDEYRGSTTEALIRDFKLGRITINGNAASENHVLNHNEFIQRSVHRHELPVLDSPIDIIYEDSEVLVVNKPPSLPIHPCGRFNRNSLSYLLENEHNKLGLHIVHRLDRMTSGVLIIGKSPEKAAALSALVRDRVVQKWYLARVDGRFPDGKKCSESTSTSDQDSLVACDQPLGPLSRKLGLQAVLPESEGGKPSKSLFRLLAYNGRTSLVECQPLTGRTHQLRVHLQYLGHPIANDPLYNSDVWGPEKGRGGRFGKSRDQLVEDLTKLHDSEQFLLSFRNQDDAESATARMMKRPRLDLDSVGSTSSFNPELWLTDPNCEDCLQNAKSGSIGVERPSRYRDPGYNELVLFLHAARYRGPEFDYCAPMPAWAGDDFDCSKFV